jgi:hypothetical protein
MSYNRNVIFTILAALGYGFAVLAGMLWLLTYPKTVSGHVAGYSYATQVSGGPHAGAGWFALGALVWAVTCTAAAMRT